MSDAVLVTGGTGFLGMCLVARLLERSDGPDIFVGVRARDRAEAAVRVDELLARLYESPPRSARRLRGVAMDLTADGLGLSARDRLDVTVAADRIIHCAASISFTLPVAQARRINVDGTRRVLDLARAAIGLDRFVHVSTAYVAGRSSGAFTEYDLGGSGFRNSYELTKMEAELAVAAGDDLPTAVVRPSIVVGESDSGWTSAFNVLYWPLQAFARGLMKSIPADPAGVVDMVPVDYVTDVIERAAFLPGVEGTFHAVAAERAVTVARLIELVCGQLGKPAPRLDPPGTLPPGHPAAVFEPYFDVKTRFQARRSRLLAPGAGRPPDPAGYLRVLLDFGARARWGKRAITREAARATVAPGVA